MCVCVCVYVSFKKNFGADSWECLHTDFWEFIHTVCVCVCVCVFVWLLKSQIATTLKNECVCVCVCVTNVYMLCFTINVKLTLENFDSCVCVCVCNFEESMWSWPSRIIWKKCGHSECVDILGSNEKVNIQGGSAVCGAVRCSVVQCASVCYSLLTIENVYTLTLENS